MRAPRAWLSCAATLAVGAALGSSVARADEPPHAYVGVYLHDVTRFDQKDGEFEADFDLWVKWTGELDPDAVRLANAAAVEREDLGRESDGGWSAQRWRVRGTLRGEFPLQQFPFDAQTLAIRLELPERRGALVPDLASSGMSETISVTGWRYDPEFRPRVEHVRYPSDLGSIDAEGRPTAASRVSFEVTLRRPFFPVAMKFFLPLGIILLVGLVALWLHPDQIESRASIGVTALLSCFAFQFVVADTMPDVAYLTFADRLFMGAYGLGTVTLLQSVLAYGLDRGGHPRTALWLDRLARVLLPAVAATAVFVVAPRTPRPVPDVVAPVARGETPRSARGVLRIGTNQLPSILGSPVFRATSWGLVREQSGGPRRAFLAETAPSVASRSMRFLAGGQLVVTWRLREGARWSDGSPIDAEDLRFAVQVAPDPRVAFSAKKDARTLAIRYTEPVAQALEGFAPLPRKRLESAYKSGGYDAVRDLRRGSPLPATGPYQVTEFVAREKIVVEANPHFLGAAPAIPRVELLVFPDSAALVQAFEGGAIDITVPNAVTPDDARGFAARRADAVHIRPSAIQTFLQPDLDVPLLAKRDVRRAILMAIDRLALAREVHGDAGRLSDGPDPGPRSPGVLPHPYDPAEARRLLEQAAAVGASLPILHGSSPVDRAVAERIVTQLQAVGLSPERREIDDTLAAYRSRHHGGLLVYGRRADPDSSVLSIWNLPIVDGRYDRDARHDAFDDSVLQLVEHEERALYAERRRQLRERLAAAYSERLPLLPLMFGSERVLADPKLEGWQGGPADAFAESLERWHFVE